VPWSHRKISAEAVLRPASKVTLQSSEDAMVSEVLVKEGDVVSAGQPILRLSSPAVEEEARRLLVERERFERESNKGRDVSNAILEYQAGRRWVSARVGLQNAESRREDLLLRSPIAGRVLTHRPEDLTGRNVLAGRALVEIGDTRKLAADVGISERLFPYLRTGAPVRALIKTSPVGYRYGTVEGLSAATE